MDSPSRCESASLRRVCICGSCSNEAHVHFPPSRTRTFAHFHTNTHHGIVHAQTLHIDGQFSPCTKTWSNMSGRQFTSAGSLETHSYILFSHSPSTRTCLTTTQQTETMVQSLTMQLQRFTQNKRSSGGDADDDATSALQQQVRSSAHHAQTMTAFGCAPPRF